MYLLNFIIKIILFYNDNNRHNIKLSTLFFGWERTNMISSPFKSNKNN